MRKEFAGKKILVLGGFALACDIVKHAQNMGAYVIVADYNESCPAKNIANEFVCISALDVDSLVSYCKLKEIEGVATGFVDILLQPCYDICRELKLPCYFTPKMLAMSTSKVDFKNTCIEHGVPVPKTYLVASKIDDDVYESINYPVFVKPLDSSGSRGAGVCYTREQLDFQFAKAKNFSPSNTVVIEDYLTGREFLLNYIAVNGEYRLISMFDRYICDDRGSAINYANLSIAPSKSIKQYLKEIHPKVVTMFKNLGFTDGLFFLQGFANNDKIIFFEMGCRLGGSFYNLEKACTNLDSVDMVVRYAFTGKLMEGIDKVPENVADFRKIAVCVNYLLKGREATIGSISGLDDVISIPACVGYEQRQFVGERFFDKKTVDRPVLSLDLVENNMDMVKTDIKYINSVFEVKDVEGNSLLMEKFDFKSY